MSQLLPTYSSVSLRQAYYSLVQFCPDRVRNERVNVAIILESPKHQYISVKYRRYMDKVIRCIDPQVDTEAVRLVVSLMEAKIKSKEIRDVLEDQQALFQESNQPKQISDIAKDFNEAHRSLWLVTEPKPILVPGEQPFEQRLEILYNNLVANKEADHKQNWDKSFVKQFTVDALRKRELQITENPDPLPAKGQLWGDSSFDALHATKAWTFFQFFSFDTQTPDLDQSKAFVTTVSDLRGNTTFRSDNGFFYVAVVQKPVHQQSQQNKVTYANALEAFRRNSIPYFSPEEDDIFRISQSLIHNSDPGKYQAHN